MFGIWIGSSLRILTGGVIRTIVLLFEIFIDDENGNAISDLEKILDRVTPLYKHRMDDLQPLQREIAETLALRSPSIAFTSAWRAAASTS